MESHFLYLSDVAIGLDTYLKYYQKVCERNETNWRKENMKTVEATKQFFLVASVCPVHMAAEDRSRIHEETICGTDLPCNYQP